MSGVIETVARYDVSRWILWAGAGISVPPPASMPLGGDLTRFVLETACGAEASRRLLAVWEKAQALCNEHFPAVPFPPFPRLESILNAIAKAENVAGDDLSLIAGLGSMCDVPPNANHLLLAAMVMRGASVVTTNFDMAIQSAFRVLEPPVDSVPPTEESGLFREFHPLGAPGAGSVIHVHGSADSPMDLGATLQQVKKGLAPSAINWLDRRLQSGAVLVFLGYSASDAFDVTPWLGSRPEGAWPKSAIAFVQHGSGPIPVQARDLSTGFQEKVFENGDTSQILNTLANLAGVSIPSPKATTRFDWRAAFHAAMTRLPGTAARALANCAVCNELGINVDLVDEKAYVEAKAEYEDADTHPVHKIFPLAARGRGNPREELAHLKKVDPENKAILHFYYYWGRLRRAVRAAFPVAKILQAGGERGEVTWMPYTSMTVHVRNYLRPYLAFPPETPQTAPALEQLLEVTKLLASRGLADLQAVHQVSTAYRAQLLLEATRGSLNRKLEEQILKQYAEQSQIQGYAGCWRDFAICRILLLRGGAGDRGILAAEARAMLDAAGQLSRVIGDKRAQRQTAEILRLLLLTE